MGLEVATIALIAGATIGGVAGVIKGKEEKKVLKKQARREEENARRQAQATLEEARETKSRQKLKFLKSGVDLEGSPLLQLEETLIRGGAEAGEIRRIGSERATSLRKAGRSALLSSIVGGTTQGATTGASLGSVL